MLGNRFVKVDALKRNWLSLVLVSAMLFFVGVVLAATLDKVKNGHEYHISDLELDCSTCHVSIDGSTSSNDRNIPDHEACFECHDGDSAPDDCEWCHLNPDEAEAKALSPRAITFSHEAHLGCELECTQCHTVVGKNERDQLIYGLPSMPTCMTCHDGRQVSAECTLCHINTDNLLPQDHRLQWMQRHDEVARSDISTCAQCHVQEQSCDMCHRGDNLQGIPHREGFVDTHAFSFYSKSKDCTACHDFAVDCVSCHRSRRVFPTNHSLPNWATRPHGDVANTRTDNNRHADFAETDMDACAACHDQDQPICARCHDGVDDD